MSTVTSQIFQYIKKYETLTGKKPGGIPITSGELDILKEEVEPFLTKDLEETEDILLNKKYQVNQFGGIDLYFDDNSKKLRDI